MTDQKAHDIATAEGMPERNTETVVPHSTTAAEVALQHLHERVHALEEAFLGFLSHEQHNHPAVLTWTNKMRDKFNAAKKAIREELTRLGSSDPNKAGKNTAAPSKDSQTK